MWADQKVSGLLFSTQCRQEIFKNIVASTSAICELIRCLKVSRPTKVFRFGQLRI